MLAQLLQPFFSTILIGLDIDEEICQVNILRIKNKRVRQNIKTEFKIINNLFSLDALKLIHFYQKKYPFTYLGILGKTPNQGALPTTKLEEYINFGISSQGIKVMPFDYWSAFIKDSALTQERGQIKNLGTIDCIFSPFTPISFLAQKENKQTTLYILQSRQSVALCIARESKIIYGGVFDISNDIAENNIPEAQKSGNVDVLAFEDILNSLSDDLEDLDELDNLDSDAELMEPHQANDEKLNELKDFMRATTIANIIEHTIQEYYGNPHYQGTFIDQVVILDTYGIAPDAINHLKDTLMLDIIVKPFSPAQEVTSLMLKEFSKGNL